MKILVFGIPGSGKTTFSNRLSEELGIPVFHIDRHFFEPGKGWRKRPAEDFLSDVTKQLKQESWIIDGNGMRTLEKRYKEADLVIFCALPLRICFTRVFQRAFAGLFFRRKRPDCPEGAGNRITWRLLKYMWNFHASYSTMLEKLKERYPHTPFIQAHSDQNLETLLKKFSKRE